MGIMTLIYCKLNWIMCTKRKTRTCWLNENDCNLSGATNWKIIVFEYTANGTVLFINLENAHFSELRISFLKSRARDSLIASFVTLLETSCKCTRTTSTMTVQDLNGHP